MSRSVAGKLVVSTLLFGASLSVASAADMPLKAPPPPPPAGCVWNGFYVGANAGGHWTDNNTWNSYGYPTFASATNLLGSTAEAGAIAQASTTRFGDGASGFAGGGQIGYNFCSFAGSGFVAGFEADIDGLSNSNKSRTVFNSAPVVGFAETYSGTIVASRSLDYVGTVRARLGFLATPTTLLYATGGLAYGGASSSATYNFNDPVSYPAGPNATGSSSASGTRAGWVIGVGAEWMLLSNWSAKLEYLHYDLGNLSSTTAVIQNNPPTSPYAIANARWSTHYEGDFLRVGLKYHFNLDGPVAARY